MPYLLFLEGIITFISPCFLPLLPVYISYFSGDCATNAKPVVNSAGFVAGFTAIFVSLGAFAGTIGSFLLAYQTPVNVITGALVVLFGLNYLGVLPGKGRRFNFKLKPRGQLTLLSAFLFGTVVAIAWMPCISKFLAAVLMRAAQNGSAPGGMFMLFIYSMGLGIPFVASAMLIHRLKGTFDLIKKHQRAVNIASGALLVTVGLLMMAGLFSFSHGDVRYVGEDCAACCIPAFRGRR